MKPINAVMCNIFQIVFNALIPIYTFWDDEKIKLKHRISSTSTYPQNYDDIYVK